MSLYQVTVFIETYNGESQDEVQTQVRDAIKHNTDFYPEDVCVEAVTPDE